MYLSESLQSKWEGVLEHPDLPAIKDPYRKAVTAVILENQAVEMQKASGMLTETGPTNSLGSAGGFGGSAAAGESTFGGTAHAWLHGPEASSCADRIIDQRICSLVDLQPRFYCHD